MKNPFAKEDNRGMIAAVLLGGVALGAVAYLYLTDSGKSQRGKFKKTLEEKGKEMAASAVRKKLGISKKLVKNWLIK
ncbi:MAG: hypothetical protein EOP47_07105 [Sphingobacteriaceae bacterium]|nr:MAG: hypothetical protein EOP47_07105 [Sphingobacteriaceae bacterium]